ncbi:MFS transporter, NNP family, nitrate/nitrite transporter [Jatrophihabitans endophyticus]|uniref:MFS transporter, NNP family, nitrate/nitrite transporter n=1 Tax=Jatrophihabitans endophyticus TaxID=1206085 RepID=A0A1M5T0D7_9ACTN|nr:nitrate/nitrite transporter [Jatrophihabitans endophyticus]SHH44165.1 MFS transporter, NNP family, nitrate/nitrite transporter [Jatrophihabitans endophyticus]
MTTTAPRPTAPVEKAANPRWITDWHPEDPRFWETTGKRVARRNLIFSILGEHVGFSIWSLWSVLVLFLTPEYGFSTDPKHAAAEKFLLTTLPTALGAVVRLPYTFAVAKFGGRNWTVVSASLLLVPTVVAAFVVTPGVSYGTLLLVAALAGVGGGNFASSMANINSFYPQRLKGTALGLNAGGGNIGVAAIQIVGLLVLATAGKEHPRVMLAIYIPLIVLAALGAALFMDNIAHVRNEKRAMRDATKQAHTWIVSVLYIGTFGSFIGFGFAFGQVLQNQFGSHFLTDGKIDAVKVAYLTFLGPLVGSLIRPVGGWLADRVGGARTTFWNFVLMAIAAAVVFVASQQDSLGLFFVGFVTLFVFSGVGNGSTYKMIPAIFRTKAQKDVADGGDAAAAEHESRRLANAVIGIAGAVGAFGGVLVNIAFRQSFLSSGTGDGAYLAFIGYYVVCAVVTWVVYLRVSQHRLEGV